MQNLIDALLTTCTFIATCVETVSEAAKFTINLNYKIVAAVVESISSVISAIVTLYNHIKPFFASLLDILIEVYCSITSIFIMLFKFVQHIINVIQSCISNFILSCQVCFQYTINAYLFLKYCIGIFVDFVNICLQNGIGALLSFITGVYLVITTAGNICVNFVTGVWQGLGFVLSSVAYFPVYCMQCIDDFLENSWRNLTQTCVDILNTTTKENYLGIVIICLLYLALSNTFRFMNSRGLTLFPHTGRFGSRNLRERRTTQNWNFDRGFESDYEDLYGSDAEDGTWIQEMNQTNNSDSESSEDESVQSSSHSLGISDSDTDEYTIVSEESDSDASINSQTFSTESSDHEIEVLLPQVDERYSLRNRASTPSHMPKAVSTPEDFDREMEKERDKRKCVICQDEIKSVLVLPCKHLCMCVLCADQIVRSNIAGRRVCPLCRSKITKVMNIYV